MMSTRSSLPQNWNFGVLVNTVLTTAIELITALHVMLYNFCIALLVQCCVRVSSSSSVRNVLWLNGAS